MSKSKVKRSVTLSPALIDEIHNAAGDRSSVSHQIEIACWTYFALMRRHRPGVTREQALLLLDLLRSHLQDPALAGHAQIVLAQVVQDAAPSQFSRLGIDQAEFCERCKGMTDLQALAVFHSSGRYWSWNKKRVEDHFQVTDSGTG